VRERRGKNSRFGTAKQIFGLRSQVFARGFYYLKRPQRGSRARWHEATSARMIMETIKYMRELAQTCTRLARTCPHRATSHALEEVAVDLMAKAHELEREYDA
jgi:hypothetical protein